MISHLFFLRYTDQSPLDLLTTNPNPTNTLCVQATDKNVPACLARAFPLRGSYSLDHRHLPAFPGKAFAVQGLEQRPLHAPFWEF